MYSIPTENSLTFGIHMAATGIVATFIVSCCVKIIMVSGMFVSALFFSRGTAVTQWLRYCTTNRKVAGSIPDGIIGIFH